MVVWGVFFGGEKQDNYNVNVTTMNTAADGLDLQAVGALVQKAKDAEQFEKLINDPAEGINNLDLDEDGKADYIKVTEYGSGTSRGFSLTTELQKGDEQEIATIDIESTDNKEADVEVRGNPQVYGQNHYYQSHYSMMDVFLLSYLFSPHRSYMSPWGYGYYPSYYRPYSTMEHSNYRSRVASANASSKMASGQNSSMKTRSTSPNVGKNASNIKAPLKNPTSSQKSFQSRNPSNAVRSGGFGRSTSSPSVRTSSYGRSGSGFGGK